MLWMHLYIIWGRTIFAKHAIWDKHVECCDMIDKIQKYYYSATAFSHLVCCWCRPQRVSWWFRHWIKRLFLFQQHVFTNKPTLLQFLGSIGSSLLDRRTFQCPENIFFPYFLQPSRRLFALGGGRLLMSIGTAARFLPLHLSILFIYGKYSLFFPAFSTVLSAEAKEPEWLKALEVF